MSDADGGGSIGRVSVDANLQLVLAGLSGGGGVEEIFGQNLKNGISTLFRLELSSGVFPPAATATVPNAFEIVVLPQKAVFEIVGLSRLRRGDGSCCRGILLGPQKADQVE